LYDIIRSQLLPKHATSIILLFFSVEDYSEIFSDFLEALLHSQEIIYENKHLKLSFFGRVSLFPNIYLWFKVQVYQLKNQAEGALQQAY
jgi:hypothetical protein